MLIWIMDTRPRLVGNYLGLIAKGPNYLDEEVVPDPPPEKKTWAKSL